MTSLSISTQARPTRLLTTSLLCGSASSHSSRQFLREMDGADAAQNKTPVSNDLAICRCFQGQDWLPDPGHRQVCQGLSPPPFCREVCRHFTRKSSCAAPPPIMLSPGAMRPCGRYKAQIHLPATELEAPSQQAGIAPTSTVFSCVTLSFPRTCCRAAEC